MKLDVAGGYFRLKAAAKRKRRDNAKRFLRERYRLRRYIARLKVIGE